MKKIISSILIPCLILYFFGCYSSREITKEEFKTQVDKEEVTLLTRENKKYKLYSDQYFISDDTVNVLNGSKTINIWKGSKLIKNGSKVPFSGRIPLDDVNSFHVEEFNTLLTVGSALITLGILVVVALSTWKPWGNKGLFSTAK
jgi:hypothetical protein